MSGVAVIGVDPGGRDTGVVVVRWERWPAGGELVGRATVGRDAMRRTRGLVDVEYLDRVAGELDDAAMLAASRGLVVAGVGVEDVTRPAPPRRDGSRVFTDTSGALAAATVAGAVVAWARGCDLPVGVVAAGGNGSHRAETYPQLLHDPRGACRGGTRDARCDRACAAPGGKRRHERSAWDVAVHAAGIELGDRVRAGVHR